MNHVMGSYLHRLLRPVHHCVLAMLIALAGLSPAFGAEASGGSEIGLKLMVEGIGAPITLVSIPDGSGRLLVAEQSGVIHLIDRDGKKSEQPFLDLRPRMVAI